MDTFYVGEQIELDATFTLESTGALVEPTAVTITVRKPSGELLTPAVSKVSTGTYKATITLDQGGTWRWKAAGTGSVVAANPTGAFLVESGPF